MLPFSREQFIAVFAAYNTAVWPAQILAYALGLGAAVAVVGGSRAGSRFVSTVLLLMWAWTGVAYHALFFASINPAALGFAALFVIQGLLFGYAGVVRGRLRFGPVRGPASWLGWGLIGYSGVLYPMLGAWSGQVYPAMPMFGITPCPVVLFTFGLLLLTQAPVPKWLLAIPLGWSLLGGSAAFLLGIAEDWPLLFSGLSVVALARRDRLGTTLKRP